MKTYKIVYIIGENKAEMKVYAKSLTDAQSTAKTLLKEKNAKVIGIVETMEIAEHKNVLLCEDK